MIKQCATETVVEQNKTRDILLTIFSDFDTKLHILCGSATEPTLFCFTGQLFSVVQ